jgi:nucleotide-binding universal stress UspA family protein
MKPIQRILVPVDFSASSRAALEAAAFLAEKLGASVDVLHVWEPPGYVGPEVMIHMPGKTGLPLVEFAHTEAGRDMERFLADFGKRGLRVSGRLETGLAVQTILRVAGDDHYDLIVMGTRGRTGLSHLMLGSVAERVVRRAACPVLTVREPEAEPAR